MKKEKLQLTLVITLTVIAIFGFFCALFCWLGPYNFVYREHLSTFYYDLGEVIRNFEQPGGLCKIIANFIKQLNYYPVMGILITSALFTGITFITARLLRSLARTPACCPLALLPAVALAILSYSPNYLYSGNVAILLMLLPLNYMVRKNGQLRYSTPVNRLLYTGVCTIIMYCITGAVALLFGVLVFIIKLFINPKRAVMYLLCPLVVILQGWISVRSGMVSDMAHAILPNAYYTSHLSVPSFIYAPWILMIAIFAFTCLFAKVVKSRAIKIWTFALSLIGVFTFAVMGRNYVDQDTELFKELNCYIHNGEWAKVTERCESFPLDNPVIKDCCNLALAEQGLLADSLFTKPCSDKNSIHITGDSNPLLYMILSDMYYSMGQIAMSQRYAFEANVELNNNSPRLLQRLVKTNIIMGNYKVAEKYLSRLEQTAHYKAWAKEMRAKLNDKAVESDPELSSKRKYMDADNECIISIHGIDKNVIDTYE